MKFMINLKGGKDLQPCSYLAKLLAALVTAIELWDGDLGAIVSSSGEQKRGHMGGLDLAL